MSTFPSQIPRGQSSIASATAPRSVSTSQWRGCARASAAAGASRTSSGVTRARRGSGRSCVLTSKQWCPMPREPRNVGASVRARLLDRARAERSDFQILLTRYALERLLYRLSVSPHRDRFILKGAMLFVTWVTDPFRPTRDLDLLGNGDNGAEAIAETFRVICAQPVADDGVIFDVAALEAAPIREEAEYGGVRVTHDGHHRRRAHPDPGRHRLRRRRHAGAGRDRLSYLAGSPGAASPGLPGRDGRGGEI